MSEWDDVATPVSHDDWSDVASPIGGSVPDQMSPRDQELQDIGHNFKNGNSNFGSALYQTLANRVAGVTDMAGAIADKAMNNPLVDYGASQIQPTYDKIQPTIDKISDTIMNSAPVVSGGQDIQPTFEATANYLSDHPDAARDLKATQELTNAGSMVVAPATEEAGILSKAIQPGIDEGLDLANSARGAIGNVGTAIKDSGQAARDAARQAYIQDLVMPMENTAKKAQNNIGRKSVQDGLLGKTVVTDPSLAEQMSAMHVGNIEGVSPDNLLQENYNAIKDANTAKAQELQQSLSQVPVRSYHLDNLNGALDSAGDSLSKNTTLKGNAQDVAQDLVNQAKGIIAGKLQNGPLSMNDIWQVRKDLDSYVDANNSGGVFNPEIQNAQGVALKKVRNTLNSFLIDNSPDVATKDSLSQMNSLYNAMDNVAPKAAKEAPTPIGRMTQKVKDLVPPGANLLSAAGIAGVKVPAALGYGAYKAVTNPALRTGLGGLLEKIGGIQNASDLVESSPGIAGYLAAPESSLITDLNGQTRLQTPAERDSSILDRQRAQQLGMAPIDNNMITKQGNFSLGHITNNPIDALNQARATLRGLDKGSATIYENRFMNQ